jgi:hypothetical protein
MTPRLSDRPNRRPCTGRAPLPTVTPRQRGRSQPPKSRGVHPRLRNASNGRSAALADRPDTAFSFALSGASRSRWLAGEIGGWRSVGRTPWPRVSQARGRGFETRSPLSIPEPYRALWSGIPLQAASGRMRPDTDHSGLFGQESAVPARYRAWVAFRLCGGSNRRSPQGWRFTRARPCLSRFCVPFAELCRFGCLCLQVFGVDGRAVRPEYRQFGGQRAEHVVGERPLRAPNKMSVRVVGGR